MQKQHGIKIAIMAGILLLILAVALLLYFQDLPALWSLSILAVVGAIGILGYVLGYLLAKRNK